MSSSVFLGYVAERDKSLQILPMLQWTTGIASWPFTSHLIFSANKNGYKTAFNINQLKLNQIKTYHITEDLHLVGQELFQLPSDVGKLHGITLEDRDQLSQCPLPVILKLKEFLLVPVAEHLAHLVPIRVSPPLRPSPLEVTSTNRSMKLPCCLLHLQGIQ